MVYKRKNNSKGNHGTSEDGYLTGIAETAQLFNKVECETLIGFALQQEPEDGKIFWTDGVGKNKDIRSCTEFFMHPDKFPGLYSRVMEAFKSANIWRLQISNLPSVQILRYTPGDHYLRHTDWSINKNKRKLSMTVQLSLPEDYEGGEVVLYGGPYDSHAPTDAGMATIWPSWVLHQVKPVTSGERWCLVAWAEGEPFR